MENKPIINQDIDGNNPQTTERINKGFWELIYGLGDYLKDMFDLQSDLDRKGTIENIKNNKKMQGANVWLLICSIMVASIGLDINSQAVIIGAMLISPLMSPILGIGLGVGINDQETLVISLKHFGLAIIIALITSILYFYISPYGEITEQIEARTVPTFLDAMVAVFGGLAGIVSSSRLDKSNAIPGVAIATALMPPLCVAGFGIAKGDWNVFLNSFYLFFLNSVFIALTTYSIVRFMRFPYTTYLNKRDKNRTQVLITVFSLIVLIPSAMILYNVWEELDEKDKISTFMIDEFTNENRDYLSHDIRTRDSINYVFIDYYSKTNEIISEEEKLDFEKSLIRCGVENPKVITRGTSNANALLDKELGKLQEDNNRQLNEYAQREALKDQKIRALELKADSLQHATTIKTIVEESKIFLPQLKDIDLVQSRFDDVPILLVKWEDELYSSKVQTDLLYKFVKIKTGMDTLVMATY